MSGSRYAFQYESADVPVGETLAEYRRRTSPRRKRPKLAPAIRAALRAMGVRS